MIDRISEYQTTISSAVEEQSASPAEINQGVTRAAAGSSEIAETIAGVAASTRGAATAAEDAKSSAAQMQTMSTELAALIGRFRY